MTKAIDPYYNRKPVPSELIKDVGITGLTAEEEFLNRERKYSVNGDDLRKFSRGSKNSLEPASDPYYNRRRVSAAETTDVGVTGLTPEEEYQNRERKYSVNGVDVRKFSKGTKNSLEPASDPYYNRKKVTAAETVGVGDLNDTLTPAEQYEVRERKQSLFQLSSDPFDIVAARHRQSISGAATGASAAATRRRSSAVAPDAAQAAAAHGQSHSGYDGGNKLETIVSKADVPAKSQNGASSGVSDSTLNRDSIDPVGGQHSNGDHTRAQEAVVHHYDPDAVAPHEKR